MDFLLSALNTIWGRLTYLIGIPLQSFGEWAWRDTPLYLLSPEIALLAAVLLICLIEVFSKRDNYLLASWIAIVGLLVNFAMTVHMMLFTSRYFNYSLGLWWGGLETLDPYAIFFKQIMDWGDILLFLALFSYKPLKQYRVEFIIIVLTGTIAFDLMVGSSDLLAVYVMTEFGGICAYILAAYYKRDLRSLESGLKYFITGAASSTALLFALSIFYGAVGTTNMYEIKRALVAGGAMLPPVVFSIVLMLVALGYKIGLAPFHLWVADVYEGAPTPVAAYISVFPKVAGFAVLLRLLFIPLSSLREIWTPILMVMAVLSLVFGSVMAMRQTSFRRMMAFSGVSHVGYMLLGVISAAQVSTFQTESVGFYSAMFYAFVYFFMNVGIFIAAMAVETQGGTDHLDSYNGLIRRNGFLTILITLLILALIGLPPSTGFWAKFMVIYSLLQYYPLPANIWLAAFAVLATILSAYYYMQLAYRMWVLSPPVDVKPRISPPLFSRLAVTVPALIVFALGVFYCASPYEYVKGAWFLTDYSEGQGV